MYSSTTLPPIRVPYIIIGIGMEGGRGGRGVLDYLPDCSEDHSACGGGKGFGHKNGHMARGGGLVLRSLFLHSYFSYSVLGVFYNGSQGGVFFSVLNFNLGVFSRFPEIYSFFFHL